MDISVNFSTTQGKATIKENGTPVLAARFDVDGVGKLEVRLWYDFRPEPLVLRADTFMNRKICVEIHPHHVKLLVNGELKDEEWPCGELKITDNCYIDGEMWAFIRNIEPEVAATDTPFFQERA